MITNLNDTTPAAPSGKVNVKWQQDGSGNGSAYVEPCTATTPGAVPTPPNDATKFLDGTGAFSTPSGGGGGGVSLTGTLIAFGPPNPSSSGIPAYNYGTVLNWNGLTLGNSPTSHYFGSVPAYYILPTTLNTPASYSWLGSASQATVTLPILARVQHSFALVQTTSCRVWCGIGAASGGTLETQFPATHMLAFRYDAAVDTTWHAYSYDVGAAAYTDVDTLIAPDTNFHQFAIQADGSGGFNFYIDGTLVANIPSSGHLPGPTVQMGDLIQIDADGVTGASVSLRLVSMQQWYTY
jgi:hypothetical protein